MTPLSTSEHEADPSRTSRSTYAMTAALAGLAQHHFPRVPCVAAALQTFLPRSLQCSPPVGCIVGRLFLFHTAGNQGRSARSG